MRERIASIVISRGDSGDIRYAPFGLKNFYFRRTYAIADEAALERILTIHGRALLANAAFSFVMLAGFVAAMIWQPEWTWGAAFWWLLGALAIWTFLIPAIPGAITLWIAGPLPRADVRTMREVFEAHEEVFGPTWAAWILTPMMLILVALLGGLSYFAFHKGFTSLGMAVGALALLLAPAIVLPPFVARMRRLRAETARLAGLVAERTRELQDLNRTLEQRVQDQVRHIERLGQLKHFFAAPVAEMILNDKGFDPAKVHRRELTAVSIDLRGFTAFSETSEPEEVISVLRVYHAELGILVNRCQATLEHFAGDGVMLFLNDPVELPDHPMRAIELAVALREAMRPHLDEWKANGFDIGLGVGIATGYATIGAVGYEGRWEYAAIGTVCNLAARLCAEAKDGQIVVSKRFISRLGDRARFEPLGERALKGLSRPVAAFNVVGLAARVAETV